MFTCRFKERCIKDEKLAKQKHFAEAKGIKLFLKKMTWRGWCRENCSDSCRRYINYNIQSYKNFCNSEAGKHFMNSEEKPYIP